jgi:hypothetical protein
MNDMYYKNFTPLDKDRDHPCLSMGNSHYSAYSHIVTLVDL